MIRIKEVFDIVEKKTNDTENTEKKDEFIKERPEVVSAKVYKLKSNFVKHSIYITLSYIKEKDGTNRPIEIFINSKDLTKAAEFAVLTRLISAIFRKTSNVEFILEELRSVHDPNGGYFKQGRYVHSLYSEIADIIEQFFIDIDRIKKDKEPPVKAYSIAKNKVNVNNGFYKICPECNQRSLKYENGCLVCINPNCGYSKCDN
jgi:hypothetical protein